MQKPRLSVFKFTSCDGCQLSILDMEKDLPDISRHFDIAYFLELRSRVSSDYYDIALVEGSVSTPEEILKIKAVRENSYYLVSIGACATSGGIQALKNLSSSERFKKQTYPNPEFIDTLEGSLPLSRYVHVDFELWGCPVSKEGIKEVLISFLRGKKPNIPTYSLCIECKRNRVPCVMVSKREPCMGPITKAGCGAICPSYGRGCYGCFGPSEDPNIDALKEIFSTLGLDKEDISLRLKSINSLSFWKTK